MSRQAVSFATREKRFFRVEADGQDYVPAFFVHASVDRRVPESTAKELGSLPGWLKWDFFTAPRETLVGMTALDALSRGKEKLVREVAERFVAEATA